MSAAIRVGKSTRRQKATRVWLPKALFTERTANRLAREAIAELMEADFVNTVSMFQAGIDIEGLGQVIATGGDLGAAESAIGLSRMEGRLMAQVVDRLNQAIAEGAELGLRFAPPALSGVPPTLVNEIAASWIQTEGASLVAGITERTRAGVQQALLDVVTGQVSPTTAAAQIGDLVGLTPRQIRTVNRFRFEVEAQLIPFEGAETVLVRETIERQVQEFARKQLRARGAGIAETEVQAAIQQGERGFWEVAADQGAVDIRLVRKTWFTVNDDRVCPICMPLHGVELAELSDFVSPEGWTGKGPPAHPRCRCYLKYAIAEELAARYRFPLAA